MYRRPSVLLLVVIVCVTGNGKCGFKDTVKVSAESLDGTPYANSHGYLDTLVVEMQPSLQGRPSPEEDGSHDGQRQPNSDGSARERWRRGTSAGRKSRASARISIAYRLWAVPLAALTALFVFSALQRRCAGLRQREHASAAGGAFLRRLDPTLRRLWEVCGGRSPGEGGWDTSPLVNTLIGEGAADGDAPADGVPHVLIPMDLVNHVAAEGPRKPDLLIITQIVVASVVFLALAIYQFYSVFTEGLELIPHKNVTRPGYTSTVGPFSEPPLTGTSTAGFESQSTSVSTGGADASSGGHSAATSDVLASGSSTSGTNAPTDVSAGDVEAVTTDAPRSEDTTLELDSQPAANSTAGAGMNRTQ